jgi:uncharacterized protein (DUF1330 family)
MANIAEIGDLRRNVGSGRLDPLLSTSGSRNQRSANELQGGVLASFHHSRPVLNQRVARFPLVAGFLRCERFCTDSAAFNRHCRRTLHTSNIGSDTMKTRYTVALSMLAGAALGGAAIQGLHAQAKPPVYTVSEIQITDLDAYLKEFAPVAQASIKAAGGKFVAGGPGTSLEGAPPATRVTIQMWDSLEKAKAWRNGAEYKKAREIGDKYAKFRAIAVEGTPQ